MASTKAAVEQLSIGEMFSGPTIIVKIGVEEKPYCISKALVMHHSGYFRGAFNSDNFVEGATGETSFRDVEPHVFEPFLEWLYTQRLPASKMWHKNYNVTKSSSVIRQLVNLYVFADRFLVPELKKYVLKKSVDVVNANVTETPGYEALGFIFGSLAEDDTYLQFVVDIHCRRWTAEVHKKCLSLKGDIEQLPTIFFLKAMSTYANMHAAKDKTKLFVAAEYLKDDV